MQALPGLAALIAAWVVLTAPGASAQEGLVLRADLDGDGAGETWRLVRGEGDRGDLVVETAGASRTVQGIVWWGPMPGQEPWLDLSPAGSVRIGSGNDAVGRHRWQMVLTVAHRRGEARVAGLTHTWRDTLDPAAGGRCDLNLLTGRGERETEAGAETVTGLGQAVPLWSWDEAQARAALEPCGVPVWSRAACRTERRRMSGAWTSPVRWWNGLQDEMESLTAGKGTARWCCTPAARTSR